MDALIKVFMVEEKDRGNRGIEEEEKSGKVIKR